MIQGDTRGDNRMETHPKTIKLLTQSFGKRSYLWPTSDQNGFAFVNLQLASVLDIRYP